MKNRAVLLSLLILFGVAALLAADFWKTKKYTEWNDKEVQLMMTNSPWAKKTSFEMTGGGGGRGDGGGGGGGRRGGGMAFLPQGEGGGGMPGGGGGGGRGGGGRGGSGDGGGGFTGPPMLEAVLRWQTALPVRQVAALSQIKAGSVSAEEADKVLSQEQPRYVLAILGVNEAALRSEDEYKGGGAVLRIKGQPDVQPSQVMLQKLQGGGHVFLSFDKASYTIKLEDKDVEFVLKTKSLSGKKKFTLKDMVYNGKLEM